MYLLNCIVLFHCVLYGLGVAQQGMQSHISQPDLVSLFISYLFVCPIVEKELFDRFDFVSACTAWVIGFVDKGVSIGLVRSV